jgi:hypothetical protein
MRRIDGSGTGCSLDEARTQIIGGGTVVLFVALAVFEIIARPDWTVIGMRLRVDMGLLLLIVLSILVRRLFTLQYARERTSLATWDAPSFVRISHVLTSVWAVAFLVVVLSDVLLVYAPSVPAAVSVGASVAALVGAFKFTHWYPDRIRGAR